MILSRFLYMYREEEELEREEEDPLSHRKGQGRDESV
jgi:hypothetical protein